MISILAQALEHLCSRGYQRHAKRLEFCERCCHALGLANYHGGQRRGAGRLRRRKEEICHGLQYSDAIKGFWFSGYVLSKVVAYIASAEANLIFKPRV